MTYCRTATSKNVFALLPQIPRQKGCNKFFQTVRTMSYWQLVLIFWRPTEDKHSLNFLLQSSVNKSQSNGQTTVEIYEYLPNVSTIPTCENWTCFFLTNRITPHWLSHRLLEKPSLWYVLSRNSFPNQYVSTDPLQALRKQTRWIQRCLHACMKSSLKQTL